VQETGYHLHLSTKLGHRFAQLALHRIAMLEGNIAAGPAGLAAHPFGSEHQLRYGEVAYGS